MCFIKYCGEKNFFSHSFVPLNFRKAESSLRGPNKNGSVSSQSVSSTVLLSMFGMLVGSGSTAPAGMIPPIDLFFNVLFVM